MKIAVLTSGRLPIPPTKGGAVETMASYYLDYNQIHILHDITVYSVYPGKDVPITEGANHYKFYKLDTWKARLFAKIYEKFNKSAYYDRRTEYFLYLCIKDIKRHYYDCIILENRPGFAVKLHEISHSPIVAHLNNDYICKDIRWASKIKSCCSLIQGCSDYICERAKSVKCNINVPVFTVYNTIDVSCFVNAVPIERSSLGLSAQDFVVIMSGRLTPEKGILELIEAIKRLNEIPNLKLIIVGASFYGKDRGKSPFMLELESATEGIRDNVYFTGFVDYANIPSYLKLADIAVVPSMWDEPFGLTVLEALAAGVPLITTNSGGIPEICEDVALLVERDHIVENLTKAILYLYNYPSVREKMSNASVSRAWMFDKEVYAKRFFETLEQL